MDPGFRPVPLPAGIPGSLLLHSMPGRFEPFADFLDACARHEVATIVCLAPDSEVAQKSPAYSRWILARQNQAARPAWLPCPIADFGIPKSPEAFARALGPIVSEILNGSTVLVHCAAGIGRTGTAAVCLCLALGAPLKDALDNVGTTGSEPETGEQSDFVTAFHSLVRSQA